MVELSRDPELVQYANAVLSILQKIMEMKPK